MYCATSGGCSVRHSGMDAQSKHIGPATTTSDPEPHRALRSSRPVKADRKAANSSVFSAGRDRVRVWMIGKQAWLAATVPLDHLISLSRVVLLVRVANHVLCPITCCHRLATNLGKDCPCMHISTLYPLFQLFSALQD